MRAKLVNEVREILSKSGFYLSKKEYQKIMPFDMIARKDDWLLIICVSMNADSSRMKNAEEMKILNDALDTSPLYIAIKGGQRKLKRGVVYSRKGIPLMSPETFHDMMLEGVPPYVFSAPGGFYVKMDSDLLQTARKKRQLSLSKLAEIAGVSRKAIQKYEEGMGADLDVALKLQEFLGEDLILPINPFQQEEYKEEYEISIKRYSDFERVIFESLISIGYNVKPTSNCPFEALTEDENEVLLSGIGEVDDDKMKKKAKIVSNLSDIIEKESVIFLHTTSKKMNIEGIPVIKKNELSKVDDKKQVSELITERSDKS